ncbi:MAG: ABC transporter substrate-binding protein, partial [Umezawaea sp.]
PTGLAVSILQGMYAGTPEKEQTRDTYQGYVVPAIAAQISDASAEPDAARRARLLGDAQRAVWATWPCLWAFVPNAVLAHRERVGDISLGPTNSYDLASARLEG